MLQEEVLVASQIREQMEGSQHRPVVAAAAGGIMVPREPKQGKSHALTTACCRRHIAWTQCSLPSCGYKALLVCSLIGSTANKSLASTMRP